MYKDGTGTSARGHVLVIGATNRPQELDDAARRRFVKRIYIPLPSCPDREILVRTLLGKGSRHSLTDAHVRKIAVSTNGFSGADLRSLCAEAAMGPVRELLGQVGQGLGMSLDMKTVEKDGQEDIAVKPIMYSHFRRALKGTRPSVAESDLGAYTEWNEKYGSGNTSANPNASSDSDSDSSNEENESKSKTDET